MVIGMHHIMLSSLVLASPAASVELQKPATPDEFSDGLQAPVDFSAVTAAVDFSEGVHIDIAYELEDVGRVRLAANGELDGWATFILLVDDTTVLDFGSEVTELAEQTWKTLNTEYLATIEHEDAVSLFNSLVQVWTTAEVEQALADAAEAAPPRSLLCDVAGGLSGGVIGGAAGAGCWWFTKKLNICKKVGYTVIASVGGYIKDKCEGAQNN